MSRSIHWLWILFALLILAFPAAAQFTPTFEVAVCPVSPPASVAVGKDVICGYVTVPEDHAQPDGATIELAVAVLKSAADAPLPDPVVMAQGGPGASSIEIFLQFSIPAIRDILWTERDIIVIEQRGTLHSRPSLVCDEVVDDLIATLDEPVELEALEPQTAAVMRACRERLENEGVNLAAYNSLNNAADYPLVLEALGYAGAWNFYGVSYGTMLGQHIIRDYGENLRSVILDSAVSLADNPFAESTRSVDRALRELFAACQLDTACNGRYPHFERNFFQLVDDLNAEPITFPLRDPDTDEVYDYTLNGDRLIINTFLFLYNSYYIARLPEAIDLLMQGNVRFMQAELPALLIDRTVTAGMQFAVVCAEDADFTLEESLSGDLYPQLVDAFRLDLPAIVGAGCPAWGVDDLGAVMDEPVSSDIPTLILAGQFDPITPPWMGESLGAHFPNSYFYTYPGMGHGAIVGGVCPWLMMDAFITDPTQAPDDRCMAEMRFDFVVSDS